MSSFFKYVLAFSFLGVTAVTLFSGQQVSSLSAMATRSNVINEDTVKADFSISDGFKDFKRCFINRSVGAYSYKWWFDAYKDSIGAKLLNNPLWQDEDENPCFTFDSFGCYYVVLEATHPNGYSRDTMVKKVCNKNYAQIEVDKIFYPGDTSEGKSGKFDIPIQGCDVYKLGIYTRFGKRVFHSEDENNDWDGNMENTNSAAPGGTYYYSLKYKKVELQDTATKQGVIVLIRLKKEE